MFPLHAGAVDRNVLQSMLNGQCLDVRHICMAAVGLVASSGQLRKYHSGCVTSEDLHMRLLAKDTDSVRGTFLYRKEWWVVSQMCCREEKHCQPFRLEIVQVLSCYCVIVHVFNPLNPELNLICSLLALLAHHFLHVSRVRVKSLTLRLLMSYIYIYI